MKETIIVTSNPNLIETLALKGKKTFNVKILSPLNLANEVLFRSGVVVQEKFINKNEEISLYHQVCLTNNYFKNNKLADSKAVATSLDDLGKIVLSEEDLISNLRKGVFKEKNDALIDVYIKYIKLLKENNLIDTNGYIRIAIKETKQLDLEIIVLKENPLELLEEELINKITNCSYKKLSLFDLFGINNETKVKEYWNCYGNNNEIEKTIDDIYSHHKLDECLIALSDTKSYSKLLFDLSVAKNIPMTFGCGVNILNAYPAKLLDKYLAWLNGNFGSLYFVELFDNPYFNSSLLKDRLENNFNDVLDALKELKLSNNIENNNNIINDFIQATKSDLNRESNKYINDLKVISEVLCLNVEDFINQYGVIRNESKEFFELDTNAVVTINKELSSLRLNNIMISSDVLESLFNKMICFKRPKEGYLHITSISNAKYEIRNNLYVLGLSSLSYPGSPKENPLILDGDLKEFNNTSLTSFGKNQRKTNELLDLIHLASALNNNIVLSYPGLNVSELKHNNASSLMFEIYKEENGIDKSLKDFEGSIIKIGYFDPPINSYSSLGKAYNDNYLLKIEHLNVDNKIINVKDKKYSPSALHDFFLCKKAFLYRRILYINEPIDYLPFVVLPADIKGSLVHSLMEYMNNNKPSREEFEKLAGETFDNQMKITVPLIKENIEKEKVEFVDMCLNGYDLKQEDNYDFIEAEQEYEVVHSSGLKIHGILDCLEKDPNGEYVIVDYKTGSNIAHIENDIDTCMQALIYAYMVEETKHIKVNHVEYRYLKYGEIIKCQYNDEIKNELFNRLLEVKAAIDNGDFDIEPFDENEEKERCKYCKYGSICGKVVKDNE